MTTAIATHAGATEQRVPYRRDEPLYALARCVPSSRYKPGRSGGRVAWLVTGSIAAVFVGGLVVGPRMIRPYCRYSKLDIARLEVRRYAEEAYPQFRVANPNRDCPVALHELNEWTNLEGIQDPYGMPYMMTCTPNGILVGSAGEDATFGTADDLWSNR